MTAIDQILERFPKTPVEQASIPQIALAQATGELTPELAQILRQSYGLELPEIDIFGFEEAREHPAWSMVRSVFPGGVLIGWDRSSELFFIDAENSMHEGPGAVFAVDKVYLEASTVRLIAADLTEFLDMAAEAAPHWQLPFHVDTLIGKLRRAIETHPERIDARPGLGRLAIADRLATRDIVLAGTYAAFLEVANGMRFVRSGLEIFSIDQLRPVDDTKPSRLLLCGQDTKRAINLVITGPGLSRPGDLLLQMDKRADLASAPSYGRFLPTVIGWIESEASERP